MTFPTDARLRQVRTFAGPPVPSRLTVRLWLHGVPRRDNLHLLILMPPGASEPYWRAIRAGDAGMPGEEVCIANELLREKGDRPTAARHGTRRADLRPPLSSGRAGDSK